MKRIRHKPDELDEEREHIFSFFFDKVLVDPNGELSTEEMLEAYQGWRNAKSLPKTFLSPIGFGKLFPHVVTRKLLYLNGKPVRGFVGVRLR